MATGTDLVGEKKKSLTNTFYLNEDKFKFLQLLQDTTRHTCCQKHEKRDQCKCVRYAAEQTSNNSLKLEFM